MFSWLLGLFLRIQLPLKSKKTYFFPSRYDYLTIVDDDNRAFGTYCGIKLSGKVVLVTGNYALITFHSDDSKRYMGFQLKMLFTENQNGMFKYEGIL